MTHVTEVCNAFLNFSCVFHLITIQFSFLKINFLIISNKSYFTPYLRSLPGAMGFSTFLSVCIAQCILCTAWQCCFQLFIPIYLPYVWELLGHDLNQWLNTWWRGVAIPGTTGESNLPAWLKRGDPGSTPP